MTDTQPQFDVFMAHNSLDKEYIRNINQKLKRSRLKTWLDEDAILAGQIIQDEIQKVIPQIKSAAIFVGTQGLGKWQKVELRSLYTQCVEKGVIVIPVLLPGVIEFPPELVFLKEHKWVSFVNDIEDEEALKELKSAIRQKRLTSKLPRVNKQKSTLNTTSKSSIPQMTNVGLSGQQRKQLQSSLIDAFPNPISLEQMLVFELDKNLRAIAGEGSLQDIVFKLIQTAKAEGWVEDLVRAARQSNPGNSLLKAIAEKLLSNDPPMSQKSAPQRLSKKTAKTSRSQGQSFTSKDNSLFLPHQLESGLWYLNHTEQLNQFQCLTSKWGKVVGFRIQISKDKDKRISVSWLIKSLLKSKDSMYITFNFDTWSDGITNFNEFLKKMCDKLEIKISNESFKKTSESLTETIAQKISNKIKKENRDVILIFAGVDEIPKLFLDQLQALWNNLVTRYKKSTNSYYHLLMFWIDFTSSIDWRNSYYFPEEITKDWQPYTVLNLNIVDKFQRDDLEVWVKFSHVNNLANINFELVKNQVTMHNTIDEIWRKSDEGKPKALLKAVYDVCNISWEEHEHKWRTIH